MDALADTPERVAIRDAVKALCGRFGDDYWSERDQTGTFPVDFHKAVAQARKSGRAVLLVQRGYQLIEFALDLG